MYEWGERARNGLLKLIVFESGVDEKWVFVCMCVVLTRVFIVLCV